MEECPSGTTDGSRGVLGDTTMNLRRRLNGGVPARSRSSACGRREDLFVVARGIKNRTERRAWESRLYRHSFRWVQDMVT